jgi:hypothetical protein
MGSRVELLPAIVIDERVLDALLVQQDRNLVCHCGPTPSLRKMRWTRPGYG